MRILNLAGHTVHIGRANVVKVTAVGLTTRELGKYTT